MPVATETQMQEWKDFYLGVDTKHDGRPSTSETASSAASPPILWVKAAKNPRPITRTALRAETSLLEAKSQEATNERS